MLLVALLGCVVPPDPAIQETVARDAYFRAWCRLYTEPQCVRDQLDECDWDRSFADRTSCMNWMRFHVSQCPGANDMFTTQEDNVRACVLQLQAVECGVDAFCVDGQTTFEADACEPITVFLNQTCAEEADG